MNELTPAESRDRRCIAGMMISASSEFDVPGADDATLSRVILQRYYRDDRVVRSLGLEPQAPFPKGHTLEQGDWSLLDPV